MRDSVSGGRVRDTKSCCMVDLRGGRNGAIALKIILSIHGLIVVTETVECCLMGGPGRVSCKEGSPSTT